MQKKINQLQNIDQKIIFKIQKNNLKKLIKKYNWENFRKKIDSIVVKKNKKKLIKYTQKEIKVFENYKKNSPNYYLKVNNILSVLKTNLKMIFLASNV